MVSFSNPVLWAGFFLFNFTQTPKLIFMRMYIYPTPTKPTEEDIKKLRKTIVDSLSNDASTWEKLKRTIEVEPNVRLPLFTHIKSQYQNEPFYFRFNDNSVTLRFEVDEDENSKSMIIGMLTYYLRYNLSDDVGKIEIK